MVFKVFIVVTLFLNGLLAWGASCPDNFGFRSKEIKIHSGFHSRSAKIAFPKGDPPEGGWPVAFVFQGTNLPVQFQKTEGNKYGQNYEFETIQKLLSNGVAVVAPMARQVTRKYQAWETNLMPFGIGYEFSSDYYILSRLIQGINSKEWGDFNGDRKVAFGISSGGYNTSRMAVSFPGEFQALIVISASYATYLGSSGRMPYRMPLGHPPTLFLHGEQDRITPINKMVEYADRLEEEGVQHRVITDPNAGHEYFKGAARHIWGWVKQFI